MEQDAIGGSNEKERNKPPGLWTGARSDKWKYNAACVFEDIRRTPETEREQEIMVLAEVYGGLPS